MTTWQTFFISALLGASLVACESSGTFSDEDGPGSVQDTATPQDTSPPTPEDVGAEPDVAPEDTSPPPCESDESCGEGMVCVKTPNVVHETLLEGTNDALGTCVNYPDGPYGTEKNDIIRNLSFFDPFTKKWVFLHEFYNNPSARMLLIASGAGWCGPCQTEAIDMVDYFNEHGPSMQVIYALFEDTGTQTEPPHKFYSVPGDHEKVEGFMQQWKDTFGVNYTLVADPLSYQDSCQMPYCQSASDCEVKPIDPPCDALHSYYKEGGIPFSMIVTTKDMRIRFVDHGYSKMQVEYNILKYVYND